jgi:ribosomal-protein-alanine N-acetyltransferase
MVLHIETPRLLLRPMRVSDAEEMFGNWACDPEVTKYLSWEPHANVEMTRKVIAMWESELADPLCIRFGIEWKENHQVIGTIDVVRYIDEQPEIGYCLSRQYWRRGIMTEAVEAVMARLKILGFKKVYISANVDNEASNGLIKKLGFTYIDQTYRWFKLKNANILVNNYVKNI